VSLVTPQSVEWVERFFVEKLMGSGNVTDLPARQADAMMLLEKEWREIQNGTQSFV
jgi:hypothetical protein